MLKPVLILSSLFAATAMAGTQFDPPDLNLEYQLHRQYMNSHGERPSSAKGLIESYSLQQGENLWSLSQMLYGDGNYWPKIWAQNKSITNPHLIRPGHTLHFQMGSEDDTPSFRFSEAEEPGLELAATMSNNPQIDVPPPETPPRPVIKVPKSFPEWQQVYRKRPDHFKIDDSRMLIKRYVPPDRIPLTAYVQEKEIEASGAFLEVEKESGLPVANQHVYVKIKKGTGQIGQKYLIVKDKGKIRKLNDAIEDDFEARFIQVSGDIVLTDTAPANFRRSSDRENYEVFRALILHAINLSLADYVLIPGEMSVIDMSKTGPEGSARPKFIGSSKHEASALYGAGDIVFLDKGSKDGVSVGQIFDIYIDRSIRDPHTAIQFATVSSGKLKIAKVSDTISTAVVLSAIDSIQQGDRVQPKMGYTTSVAPGDMDTPPQPSSAEMEDFDAPIDDFDAPLDDQQGDDPGLDQDSGVSDSDFDLQ